MFFKDRKLFLEIISKQDLIYCLEYRPKLKYKLKLNLNS